MHSYGKHVGLGALLALLLAGGTSFAFAQGSSSNSAAGTAGTSSALSMADRVQRALTADPDLSGAQIGVLQHGGTVTLTGSVASKAIADRAWRIAASVNGVGLVENRLTIIGAGTGGTSAATAGTTGTEGTAGTAPTGTAGAAAGTLSGFGGAPGAAGTAGTAGTGRGMGGGGR